MADAIADPPPLPATRGDCPTSRPCLHVRCRHHLYLDVADNGTLKLNFPDLEVWELPETCSFDVASRGGLTLEDVGEIMNLTRERVRQLQEDVREHLEAIGLYAAPDGPLEIPGVAARVRRQSRGRMK